MRPFIVILILGLDGDGADDMPPLEGGDEETSQMEEVD